MDQNFDFSFDGENYQSLESSKYRHRGTLGLANYQNYALTTGCDDSKFMLCESGIVRYGKTYLV